jgi:hypothetical protein
MFPTTSWAPLDYYSVRLALSTGGGGGGGGQYMGMNDFTASVPCINTTITFVHTIW